MRTIVTKENQEGVTIFYSTDLKNADGTPMRARRNGKTKTWKTRSEDFQIPIKHGLYDYGYIDKTTCKYWTIN